MVALIDQPPVIKKILAHLGLATEALTKPEDPVWQPKKSTLRGPPDELFPPDGQGPPATGPRAGRGSATPASRSLTSCPPTSGPRSWGT